MYAHRRGRRGEVAPDVSQSEPDVLADPEWTGRLAGDGWLCSVQSAVDGWMIWQAESQRSGWK